MLDRAPGKILDDLETNFRRLVILHAGLGLASAFVFWVRPGAFLSQLHSPLSGDGMIVIVKTSFAWAPYIISGWFSQTVLKTRDPKATLLFMLFAFGVSLSAAGLYLYKPVIGSALGIAMGVTITLLLGATLCSVLWRDNAPEE